MHTIKEITNYIDQVAPPALQESYDNAGLLVGDPSTTVSNILICLDVTEAVIDEAKSKSCELIVAHHPIIFKGLKRLTGNNYVERTVIKAIKEDIAIYASHTNLDNVKHGVNAKICNKLGLKNIEILSPKKQQLAKLSVFVPVNAAEKLKEALFGAGAGQIGSYKNCAFESTGTGSFTPTQNAQPAIGEKNKPEEVEEHKIEVIFPIHLKKGVLTAMHKAHPYEEVAYYLHQLENEYSEIGAGMVGELHSAMDEHEFMDHLKAQMNLSTIKHTPLKGSEVRKVAVCGGSGSFLIKDAIRAGADFYVSADIKYHEYFDAEGQLVIADIGHYESEIFTNEIFYALLTEKFANIALHLGQTVTNPIKYY